jgi:hypothetical protein
MGPEKCGKIAKNVSGIGGIDMRNNLVMIQKSVYL